MVHHGSDLKKKNAINSHPKRPDTMHYRNLVRENERLRMNIFDSLGNYLDYAKCVSSALGVSTDRLVRQRNIKHKQSQEPIVHMRKSEVKEKHLGEYVLMPTDIDTSFITWWGSQRPSSNV